MSLGAFVLRLPEEPVPSHWHHLGILIRTVRAVIYRVFAYLHTTSTTITPLYLVRAIIPLAIFLVTIVFTLYCFILVYCPFLCHCDATIMSPQNDILSEKPLLGIPKVRIYRYFQSYNDKSLTDNRNDHFCTTCTRCTSSHAMISKSFSTRKLPLEFSKHWLAAF